MSLKPETKKALEELAEKKYPMNFNYRGTHRGDFLAYHTAKQQGFVGAGKIILTEHPEILALEGYHKTEWVSVSDRLPEKPNKKEYQEVQCGFYTKSGKFVQFIGFYAQAHSVAYSDEYGYHEYDPIEEAHGQLYLKQGWYENVEQRSGEYDYIYLERTVTHWQPLPPAPNKK